MDEYTDTETALVLTKGLLHEDVGVLRYDIGTWAIWDLFSVHKQWWRREGSLGRCCALCSVKAYSISFLSNLITRHTMYLLLSIMVRVVPISGHQGSVSVSQGSEETIMEVSHQVHDVVPETRGAQNYHWWVWTGTDAQVTFSLGAWNSIHEVSF